MSTNKALERRVGKTITNINNYDDIGVVEIWLSDESCIHITGNGGADSNGDPEINIMISEPQSPKVTMINNQI